MTVLRKLFDVRGRTDRVGYWRTGLVLNLISAAFWTVGLLAAVGLRIGMLSAFALVGVAAALAACVPLVVRRLHDRDKSAWWLVSFYVAPFFFEALAGDLSASGRAGPLPAALLALAAFGLGAWGVVELGFVRGTRGPNRYGPAPAYPPR